jgi:hypothetical protein
VERGVAQASVEVVLGGTVQTIILVVAEPSILHRFNIAVWAAAMVVIDAVLKSFVNVCNKA